MSQMVNRRNVSEYDQELLAWLGRVTQNGGAATQEALLAMAEVLQSKLSSYRASDAIPHAGSLELIMRSVIEVLKGEPHPEYVKENIDAGYGSLMIALR